MDKNVECGGSDKTGINPQFIACGTYKVPDDYIATIEDGNICIKPIPLSEFQKAVEKILLTTVHGTPLDSYVQKKSIELLELAKKELEESDWIRGVKSKAHLDGYMKGQKERYNEEAAFYTMPSNPTTWPPCYFGGPCTNPHHDCINCPRQETTGPYTTDTNIK